MVAPVGVFAVTVAPVAGEPAISTDTERVTVSPRLKTELGAGLTIDTEKARGEDTLIRCVPLPVLPCESAAATATVCEPIWSELRRVCNPVHAFRVGLNVMATWVEATLVPLIVKVTSAPDETSMLA